MALIGANGAGKSTLVKTIVGALHPSQGFVDVGNRVQVGYFSQEHEELHDHWEVLDEIVNNFGFKEEEARKALGAFMFRGDDVFKKVGDLSGGEKARLALLKLFLQGNNFLILDEPTNHLDIPTREVVEEALKNFDGTCLVISHDRYFLDQVAKRIIDLEQGHILDFQGNFTDFKEALNQGRIHLPGQADSGGVASELVSTNGPKNSLSAGAMTNSSNPEKQKAGLHPVPPEEAKANPKKETKTNDYMREKKLGQVETEIARLEATIKMYEVQLMNPAVQTDNEQMASLASNIEQANSELEALYERWEALSE